MLMLGLKRLSVLNKYKGVVLIMRTFLKPTSPPLTRIQTCGFLNTAYFSLLLLSISLFCESHGQLETTSTTDSWSSRRRSKNQNTKKINVEVKVRKNRQQKRATRFSTLLQNELNSDFLSLACFTTHESNLSCDKSARGGGVLPYLGYIGMCRCEGYGFQAVYSRKGYINQSIWV